ncbi:MAG: DEAD/DEAH box helicase [Halobacteriota archaeon]|nr:DEAD/DEAH box helicase [Halobacteriota archaeon]
MTEFNEFNLSPELLRSVEDMGFKEPTPIQNKAIPFLLETERDLIALAQTGTGKTAAFGLPIIEKLDPSEEGPQALVLCPTRELCLQVTGDIEQYCKYLKEISVVAVYGGAKIEDQLRKIKKGVQIIVATPGRMNDIIGRKRVDLSRISTVVLDESDEMLNMGFKEELDAIIEKTPISKRTLLFSATISKQVEDIAKKYIRDPYEITVGKKNTGAENIDHIYYMVHAKDRYLALKRIADINPQIYGIIFCRTRKETKDVAEKLIRDGYDADAIHGDLSQVQREKVMNRFRSKNLQMLVATDVAARGLDVDDLSHIINYNLPDELEMYTHRSGRTGRAGRSGTSVAIINMKEKGKIKRIEKLIGKKFESRQIPNGVEICEKQFFDLIRRLKEVSIDEDQIEPYMDKVYSYLESFSREDIIKHFVALELDLLLEYYKKDRDLNVDATKNNSKRKNGRRTGNRGAKDEGFTRFHINVGKGHNVRPKDIIGIINNISDNRDIEIGAIDILGTFSFFDIPISDVDKLTVRDKDIRFNGRKIKIEAAMGSPRKSEKRSNESKRRRSIGDGRIPNKG